MTVTQSAANTVPITQLFVGDTVQYFPSRADFQGAVPWQPLAAIVYLVTPQPVVVSEEGTVEVWTYCAFLFVFKPDGSVIQRVGVMHETTHADALAANPSLDAAYWQYPQ